VKRVWAWKEASGSTITHQMRRLGDSCDWSREYFTMDEPRSHAVIEVFVRLFEQGLIYRGKRLVSWDPQLQTAVSDLEVISEEENGTLWHLRYPLEDGSGHLTVATTRPETMLGDVAVAVHPEDERYSKLVGRNLELPLCDRLIPVIADTYVDREFGTGVVKITPAHDFNDFQVGVRHGLTPLNIFTVEARVNENGPLAYQGLDRYAARKAILADLEKAGLVESAKPHKLTVPRSDRSNAVVEPMLSDQWFVRMDGMAKAGLQAVAKGETRFVPEEWSKIYDQWLENIQDWCISRQLWWGHQIPAWYAEDGTPFVGRNFEEAKRHATAAGKKITPQSRDDDVLDTWFSSALVPFTTLGWPDEREFERERRFYLPSTVLVTGFDIIFFWVARMIMTSLQFTGETAFRDVYINSIVRDAEGQKMSKSKGNTIDPLDVIDGIGFDALLEKSTQGLMLASHKETAAKRIKREFPSGIDAYGADALRFTFASLSTHGRTLNFDLKRCEGYRSFCNKLWNATRFVLMNCEGKDVGLDESLPLEPSAVDRWIVSRLQRAEKEVVEAIEAYRFDNAARAVYEFAWDEYCDWYVELAKGQLATGTEAQQRATRRTLIRVLETTLRLAHPFIPFITEELWQIVAPLAGRKGESLVVAEYPAPQLDRIDEKAEAEVAIAKEYVEKSRNARAANNIGPGQRLAARTELKTPLSDWQRAALASLAKLDVTDTPFPPDTSVATAVTSNGSISMALPTIDKGAERVRLTKEAQRLEAQIVGDRGKLENSKFLERAPANVVEEIRKRLTEHEEKLADTRKQLGKLAP
jgi:valyl-tRNA synthetase